MDRVQRHRKRLAILIDEAGTQGQLAEKVGTAESYISQLLTARNGIARKFCVRLEQATGKPDGWMDQWLPEETELPTAQPLSSAERRVLGMWRRMTPAVKRYVFGQLEVARLTPNLIAVSGITESDLDNLIIDTVTETGEFEKLPNDNADQGGNQQ